MMIPLLDGARPVAQRDAAGKAKDAPSAEGPGFGAVFAADAEAQTAAAAPETETPRRGTRPGSAPGVLPAERPQPPAEEAASEGDEAGADPEAADMAGPVIGSETIPKGTSFAAPPDTLSPVADGAAQGPPADADPQQNRADGTRDSRSATVAEAPTAVRIGRLPASASDHTGLGAATPAGSRPALAGPDVPVGDGSDANQPLVPSPAEQRRAGPARRTGDAVGSTSETIVPAALALAQLPAGQPPAGAAGTGESGRDGVPSAASASGVARERIDPALVQSAAGTSAANPAETSAVTPAPVAEGSPAIDAADDAKDGDNGKDGRARADGSAARPASPASDPAQMVVMAQRVESPGPRNDVAIADDATPAADAVADAAPAPKTEASPPATPAPEAEVPAEASDAPPETAANGLGETRGPDGPSRHEPAAPRVEAPRQVTAQVAEAARMLRDGPVELTLSPEELGRVKLTLAAGDGTMTLVVTAERGDTLDLLRRNIDQLAQDFRDMGYQSLQFSFGRDGSAQRQFVRNDAVAVPVTGQPASLTFDPQAPAPVRVAGAGLDLRL